MAATPCPCPQALVQQRAAAQMDCAAAKAAGEAEAAARWQGRVSDLRKQVSPPLGGLTARLHELGRRLLGGEGGAGRRVLFQPHAQTLNKPCHSSLTHTFSSSRPPPQLADARRRLQRSQEAEAAAQAQLQEAQSQLASDRTLLCEARQALSADQAVLRQASQELAAELVMLVSAVLCCAVLGWACLLAALAAGAGIGKSWHAVCTRTTCLPRLPCPPLRSASCPRHSSRRWL